MSGRLDWARDGHDWPHRDHSRFIECAGLHWHVQRMGRGPVLLLIHGTGAATHSWRGLMPQLAPHFDLVAADLPGHGFTRTPASWRVSLPAMAQALAVLLQQLDLVPRIVVGHSAGAAIGARLALDAAAPPAALVSLNGAWLPYGGIAGAGFSAVARLAAATPLLPQLFAWGARDPRRVRRLIEQTGSRLDDAGLALYGRLVGNAAHADAALQMMANWDLASLLLDLPRLQAALTLVVGGRDLAVPPAQAESLLRRMPRAERVELAALGHLAHEERPDLVAETILRAARRAGVGPD